MIYKELCAKQVPASLIKKLRVCGYTSKDPNLGEMLDWLDNRYQILINLKLADKESETWLARIESDNPKLKGFKFEYNPKPLPYLAAIFEALEKIDVLHQLIDLDDYDQVDISK